MYISFVKYLIPSLSVGAQTKDTPIPNKVTK